MTTDTFIDDLETISWHLFSLAVFLSADLCTDPHTRKIVYKESSCSADETRSFFAPE